MLRKYTLYLAGVLGLILGSVGCGDAHPHGGYLSAAWRIADGRTGAEASCEWAGITTVELAARDMNTGEDSYDNFNCVEYAGISAAFPPSDYAVALYGYSARDEVVASYTFSQPFRVYVNETTPIPSVYLTVQ